jgi:curved DNA-binding protein CbpA
MTHYEVLGIPDTADLYTVMRAYTYLVHRLRSGLGTRTNGEPLPTLDELNEAQLVLINPVARPAYDRTLEGKAMPEDAETLNTAITTRVEEEMERVLGPPTYYDTLGVHPRAEDSAIRKHYLARLEESKAGESIQTGRADHQPTVEEIEEAYWILSHGYRRTIYDIDTFGGSRTLGWANTNQQAWFGDHADPFVRGWTRFMQGAIAVVLGGWLLTLIIGEVGERLSLGWTYVVLSLLLAPIGGVVFWRMRHVIWGGAKGGDQYATANLRTVFYVFAIVLVVVGVLAAALALLDRYAPPTLTKTVLVAGPIAMLVVFVVMVRPWKSRDTEETPASPDRTV